jgi:hypothetical protein
MNFNSQRVQFLIEHKINPKVMKKWNLKQLKKLDNLIEECDIPQHTKYQWIYYWACYNIINL